ncbi:MAG: AI-2E family transporter [Desulfobacteraceae bacterium]|jgi:putative permease
MIQFIRNWLQSRFSDPQVISLWILILSGGLLIFFLGEMLIPVFASLIIAYLLDGVVCGLQRWHVPRMPSILIVFLLFMASLIVLIIWLLPLLSRQIVQLVQVLPSILADSQKELMQLPQKYPDFISEIQIEDVIGFINSSISTVAQRMLSWSLASVKGLISVIVYLVLVPFMVFFFLKDKKKIVDWFTLFLPDDRGLATEVWHEVNRQIANYARGKIWEVLIIWAISYTTFKLFGMEFSILVSLFVGLSVLVPYLGVTVMYLPVALISYFQWGWSSQMAYALLAYTIIQIFDGNILAPLLLSEVVNLHPIAIIVAVLIFGGLWGVWGLFFAIPLATLVHAIIKTWRLRHTPASP